MSSPTLPLFTRSLKGWFSAKGFWLVVAAALLPLLFTGAWVATHRADVAVTGVTLNETHITEGDVVKVSATVKNVGSVTASGFNTSLAVGTVSAGRLFPTGSTDVYIDHLAPGESRDVSFDWNATAGVQYVLATADVTDVVGEIDEFNNQNATPIAAGYALPNNATAPTAPANLTGTANASVRADLAVASLSLGDTPVVPGKTHEFTATFTNNGPDAIKNATAHLQYGNGFPTQTQSLDLAAGETKTVTLQYIPQEGAFWLQAYIETPTDATDTDGANNHAEKAFTVDPVITPGMEPPALPEKITIKQFYLGTSASTGVVVLYIRLVLPLVALFYGASIIADERDRRALGYILTKPTPRWLFPITKFVASFIVATVAAILGVALTYLLLFGTTVQGKDLNYLAMPLFASLLALFAYGSLFTLVGVYVEKPILAGLAFIAWEALAAPWRLETAVANYLFLAPWVQYTTVAHYVIEAVKDWPLESSVQWLPSGADLQAAVIVLVASIGALVAAAYVMKRKEFDL